MFIGAGMDEPAIVALLDQALLSPEEMVRRTTPEPDCSLVSNASPLTEPSELDGGRGP